jgi:hypothetical protein
MYMLPARTLSKLPDALPLRLVEGPWLDLDLQEHDISTDQEPNNAALRRQRVGVLRAARLNSAAWPSTTSGRRQRRRAANGRAGRRGQQEGSQYRCQEHVPVQGR